MEHRNDPGREPTLPVQPGPAIDKDLSLLGRVLSLGAELVASGKLSEAVIEEHQGSYAICLVDTRGETVTELSKGGAVVVGRNPGDMADCWRIEDEWLSKQHFRIAVDAEDGLAVIEDMASKNGTWVNDETLKGRRALSRGDCIRAGRSVFLFL